MISKLGLESARPFSLLYAIENSMEIDSHRFKHKQVTMVFFIRLYVVVDSMF